jgi:hypothetical protein
MVGHTIRLLALAAVVSLLVLACGGSKDGGPTAVPPAIPTAAQRAPGGPSIDITPKSGPPGTDVTVRGTGWAPRSQVSVTALSATAGRPYATATAGEDGSFNLHFVLEKAPDGSDLRVGRLDLVAVSGSAQATESFQVEVRRPLSQPGSGG